MPELGTGTPGSSLGHVIPLFPSKETLLYMFSPHKDVKIGTNKTLRGVAVWWTIILCNNVLLQFMMLKPAISKRMQLYLLQTSTYATSALRNNYSIRILRCAAESSPRLFTELSWRDCYAQGIFFMRGNFHGAGATRETSQTQQHSPDKLRRLLFTFPAKVAKRMKIIWSVANVIRSYLRNLW